MPNLNDMSDFLKKSDMKKGDILTFADEGQINNVDFSKAKDGSGMKMVFQIVVILPNGKQKIMTMNKTSQKSVSAKWGNETKEWVGKKIEVDFIKQLSFGEVKEVTILTPKE